MRAKTAMKTAVNADMKERLSMASYMRPPDGLGKARLFELLKRCGDDFGQSLGGFEARYLVRPPPMGLGELLVEDRLAGDPARGEGQDHEMALDLAGVVAR